MKLDQKVLKKIIVEEVSSVLEQGSELEVGDTDIVSATDLDDEEKMIDSLIGTIASLQNDLKKVNDLISKAKMIPDEAARGKILNTLKTKASDTLQMMDTVRSTIEKGSTTMEEEQMLSSLEEMLNEAMIDYDPQQRNKIRDLALELVRKVTSDPRWKEKADERPSNSVEIIWDMANVVFKQKEQMMSEKANEFLDSIGSDTPEEMASDLEKGLYQETFEIKKSRLNKIIEEEIKQAKKQGIL